MKALIFNERVVQISDAEFPVHSALTWVDVASVTPEPKVGWAYSDGVFYAPPAPPPSPLAEETALTPEDLERLLLSLPGMTAERIAQAKRDRGKPMR